MKTTCYDIIDGITGLLPKLTKVQLLEIMLLCNAWSNGIPLANIKRLPIQEDEEIKSLRSLHNNLEQKNYMLTEELSAERDRTSTLDSTVKTLRAEIRTLKSRLFMEPGVRK